jgi:glutaredoxin-related protein
MIKELLENLEVDYKLGFICQDIKNFKLFLDICKDEGIVFSKTVLGGS